jgi:hypothetical protein
VTLHRIREARGRGPRRTSPTQQTEAEIEQRREVSRRAGRAAQREPDSPQREATPEARKHDEVVFPAAVAKDQACAEVMVRVMSGVATPAEIVAALELSPDPAVAAFQAAYVGNLETVCLLHGIDPDTGEPIG